MPNVILFDDESWEHLLPLTYTRPVCELRVGIMTLREKWEARLNTNVSFITQDHLAQKYPLKIEEDNIIINSSLLANDFITKLVQELEPNEALMFQGDLLAARLPKDQFDRLLKEDEVEELRGIEISDTPIIKIQRPYDIFQVNGLAIREDFDFLIRTSYSRNLSETNQFSRLDQIFISEGAEVEHAILNASTGPIYIGPNAKVMEGSMIRGPFALCDHAVVKMGAKIYGATTIGPHCKVGGEINNSIFQSYSNKAHDGFLGNSVVGEWCNLGADTNNSNLKNNYGEVSIWSYVEKKFINTETQFCGLFMGDHSKAGINTMFNTGTVVGVGANVFGASYPSKFVPSFSWGAATSHDTFRIDKFFEMAENMMKRREKTLSDTDRDILKHIFDRTSTFRHWEPS